MNRLITLAALLVAGLAATLLLQRPGNRMEPPPPALSPAPPPSVAANQEGVALLEKGRVIEAVEVLRRARILDPGDPVIRRNLSLALTRRAALPETDPAARRPFFEEALRECPENVEALAELALLSYGEGRYEEAGQMAARLSSLAPGRADALEFSDRMGRMAGERKGLVSEAGRRFTLHYSGGKKLAWEGELLSILQAEMDGLSASLGVFPRDPVEVLVLTPDLGDRAKAPEEGMTGLYDGRIRLFIGEEFPERTAFLGTVRHEMVHALLHRSGEGLPGWFHEGVAQLLGNPKPETEVARVRTAMEQLVRAGWWVSPLSLKGSFVGLPEQERSRAYALSLLFLREMAAKGGPGLIPSLLADLGQGVSLEEAYSRETGEVLEDRARGLKAALAKGGT